MRRLGYWLDSICRVAAVIALACTIASSATAQGAGATELRTDTIYETNYQTGTVQAYSARGRNLGLVAPISFATGLAFDKTGNLYVSSDDPANYSIQKIAPDGTVTVFANSDLRGPHALAFDKNGNLYVANILADTIVSFTPAGVGTVFADGTDGLEHPVDLVFDKSGNLYVSCAFGGPTRTGTVLKFSPDGVVSVFADSGFSLPWGLAMDRDGNLYVGNFRASTIEKFSPTGEDLGVFASAGVHSPHGMIFDAAGNLYVANNAAQTIERFSPTGVDLGTFARTQLGPHFLAMFKPSGP
jgi:sugar lactone lactonase YvrE